MTAKIWSASRTILSLELLVKSGLVDADGRLEISFNIVRTGGSTLFSVQRMHTPFWLRSCPISLVNSWVPTSSEMSGLLPEISFHVDLLRFNQVNMSYLITPRIEARAFTR
jgi:hypothetical protein